MRVASEFITGARTMVMRHKELDTRYSVLATRYSLVTVHSPAMPDVQHVPILHDVVLAFQAESAARTGVGFRARVQQRVPANGFSADEMFFQVGVNGPEIGRASCRER